MKIAEVFAQFIAELDAVPAAVELQCLDAVQDALAAAIAGIGTPAVIAAHGAALSIWGKGQAPVWFSDDRLTAPGAAFVNSTLVSAMDLDDGHRAAAGHPGASIIPAVLATAATHEIDARKIPAAIAIGYEIAVRIAASRDYPALTTMVSGPWVGQGAAAAAAYLRGLPPRKIAQAIAITGASAPNLNAVSYSKFMGNHLKEGIPWATATALTAVDLADHGFTGPIDLLDNEAIHSRNLLLDRLGEKWAFNDIYFKPYSCCRWAHAAMDGVLQLQAEHDLHVSDIERIDIETFRWALRLNNEVAPKSLEAAQYSVPFCVALVLTHGENAFLPMSGEMLGNRPTLDLAGRVHLRVSDSYDRQFPSAVSAKVTITGPKGVLTREVLAPVGEPTNPMSRAQMDNKLAIVANSRLDGSGTDKLASAMAALRDGSFTQCQTLISRPLGLHP